MVPPDTGLKFTQRPREGRRISVMSNMLQQRTRQDPVRTGESWLLSLASGTQIGLPTVTQQVFLFKQQIGIKKKKEQAIILG